VTLAFSVALVLLIAASSASAQSTTLAQPSRTVYKCTVDKKVLYSDEPCVGAQRVDVEPTRGLNRSTGKELTGADVARERQREAVAVAVKPITGMSPEQFELQTRRTRLSSDTKLECARLDSAVARSEAQERTATSVETKSITQRELFSLRKRHRDLRC